MSQIDTSGNLVVQGDLSCGGSIRVGQGMARTQLQKESLTSFDLSPCDWRIHDNMDTLLPDPPVGGSGNDDIGITSGTYGTGVPYLSTGDNKAVGAVAKYARRTIQLPPNYVAGEQVLIRLRAGMKTTVSDGTAFCDVEAYKSDHEGAVSGSDLCATSNQSCNSLVFTDKDFTITATSLSPGDILDVRIRLSTSDTASVTAVIAAIGRAQLLCDTKG